MFLDNWNLKKTLKNSIPNAQETHGVHITTTTNRLKLFREIILFILRTKHNMSCGQNGEFVNVKAGDSNRCVSEGYLLKYVYYFPVQKWM